MDRFDLEQDIISAWDVVDEIKNSVAALEAGRLNHSEFVEIIKALAVVYQFKFEELFNGFEEMVANRQFVDHVEDPLDDGVFAQNPFGDDAFGPDPFGDRAYLDEESKKSGGCCGGCCDRDCGNSDETDLDFVKPDRESAKVFLCNSPTCGCHEDNEDLYE